MAGLTSRTASAPSSTANLGPGYDVFGLALNAKEDRVRIERSKSGGPGISIKIINDNSGIPVNPESNSAGRVVKRMAREFGISDSLSMEIGKGVPAGYGLGSSAASAAAAALAFKSLFNLKIDNDILVEYAAEGEIASAGTKHYDNVSASLMGGFVISCISQGKRTFIRMRPPQNLSMVVAVPFSMPVPEKKTEIARSVLPKQVSLSDLVHNVSCASTIVAGFAHKDVEMIARGIEDVIVEPARKTLIPGFDAVKQNAIGAGALAVTISGAGPSVIAFMKSGRNSRRVASAMKEGFSSNGITSEALVCSTSTGARIV